MGREIRRVPPNWEHPRYTADNCRNKRDIGEYMPMADQSYPEARKEWLDGFALWQQGRHPAQIENPEESWIKGQDWWEYSSPPDREFYRPAFTEEPRWFQVYQTVSEGTPVTPPFPTKEALVEYLVAHGDFWRQADGRGGFSREAAEGFVKDEYVPSMVITGGQLYEGIESAAAR